MLISYTVKQTLEKKFCQIMKIVFLSSLIVGEKKFWYHISSSILSKFIRTVFMNILLCYTQSGSLVNHDHDSCLLSVCRSMDISVLHFH
jgi:hypothetical protein